MEATVGIQITSDGNCKVMATGNAYEIFATLCGGLETGHLGLNAAKSIFNSFSDEDKENLFEDFNNMPESDKEKVKVAFQILGGN